MKFCTHDGWERAGQTALFAGKGIVPGQWTSPPPHEILCTIKKRKYGLAPADRGFFCAFGDGLFSFLSSGYGPVRGSFSCPLFRGLFRIFVVPRSFSWLYSVIKNRR